MQTIDAPVHSLLLGEMSETVLTGARVSAQKVVEAGFEFQYSDLDEALRSFRG